MRTQSKLIERVWHLIVWPATIQLDWKNVFECVSYLQYSTNQYPTIISSLPSAAQVTRALEPENSWQEKKKYQIPENDWCVKKRKIPDPVPQTTVENIGSATQGLLNKESKPPDLCCQGHVNARGFKMTHKGIRGQREAL